MPPKYYIPELVGPITRIKYKFLDKRVPLPDFPEHCQIQTISGCNGNCVFCPNNKTNREIPAGRKMDMGLFRRLVVQLVEMPSLLRISPYLMNEPLLDTDLPERIKYISDHKRPEQYTKIISNGSVCTERMAKGLLDAGLDRIRFSVQGIDPKAYEDLIHLKFEETVKNIERLYKLRMDGGYHTWIRVVMLRTRAIEDQLPAIQKFWEDRGIKIKVNQLENRGNHRNIKSGEIALTPLHHYNWCNRMFNQIYILCDGRLVLCCADWEQSTVMGDANKERLGDIWQSPKYKALRRQFLSGKVKGMLCENCSKVSKDDED